jgi:hypothetical protein
VLVLISHKDHDILYPLKIFIFSKDWNFGFSSFFSFVLWILSVFDVGEQCIFGDAKVLANDSPLDILGDEKDAVQLFADFRKPLPQAQSGSSKKQKRKPPSASDRTAWNQ